jgi:hypothetical protein
MRSLEGHGGARGSGRPRDRLHAPTQQQRHDSPCRLFSLTVASFFKNWQEFSITLSTYNSPGGEQ